MSESQCELIYLFGISAVGLILNACYFSIANGLIISLLLFYVSEISVYVSVVFEVSEVSEVSEVFS